MNKREEICALFADAAGSVPWTISFGRGGTPHILLFGAVHGNEDTGLDCILHLCKERDTLRGTITAVLGNPKAYQKDVRYIDEDLNRIFSDPITGSSYEAGRARELDILFKTIADSGVAATVLDVHTMSAGEEPLFLCHKDDTRAYAAVQQLPAFNSVVLITEELPFSLCALAQRYNFSYIGMECGKHKTQESKNHAHAAIREVLLQNDMLSDTPLSAPKKPKTVLQIEKPIAIAPGLRFTLAELRTITPVAKGAVYAVDNTGKRVAEKDLALFCPSKRIQTTDADAGFICSYIT